MTYQTFIDNTIDALTPLLPSDADIRSEKIRKNNGFTPQALIISTPGENIFPTIYMDDFYERARGGGNLDEIYKEILDTYNSHKIEGVVDTSFLSDFNQVKDRIALRLINKEKNEELLLEVPYLDFLDLALIPSIIFNCDRDIYAGSLINNKNMKEWKISKDTLLKHALENTPKILPGKISSLYDFLGEIAGEIIVPEADERDFMHILTNERRSHGAVCMTYTELIREFSEKVDADVFILPSSVHEVMLVADDKKTTLEEYSALVKDVNETQVAPSEVLSDHAYLYKRDTGEIVY